MRRVPCSAAGYRSGAPRTRWTARVSSCRNSAAAKMLRSSYHACARSVSAAAAGWKLTLIQPVEESPAYFFPRNGLARAGVDFGDTPLYFGAPRLPMAHCTPPDNPRRARITSRFNRGGLVVSAVAVGCKRMLDRAWVRSGCRPRRLGSHDDLMLSRRIRDKRRKAITLRRRGPEAAWASPWRARRAPPGIRSSSPDRRLSGARSRRRP